MFAEGFGGDAMPSPFPGMNPYLERASVWRDFHETFMPAAREILSAQVLPRYFVRIDEKVYIHELSTNERRFIGRSDILVPALAPAERSVATSAVLEAPAQVFIPAVDTESQSFLEVRDRDS